MGYNQKFVPNHPSPLSSAVDGDRKKSLQSSETDVGDDSKSKTSSQQSQDITADARETAEGGHILKLDAAIGRFDPLSFGEDDISDTSSESSSGMNSEPASPASISTTQSEKPSYSKETDHDLDDIDYDMQSTSNSFIANNLELSNFPLFKRAPRSFYNKIISHLKLIQYHPSNFIIKKGDPSKSMYWILKGTVCIASPDGDSIYNELSSGEFFGEIGILFNRPRTANVIAKTKVLLGVLTSKDFNIVLKYFPLMERRIRDEAQERLAMLDKKSNQLVSKINPHSHTLHEGNNRPAKKHDHTLPPPLLSSNSAQDKVDSSVSIQQFIKNLPIFENLPSNIIHKLALGAEPLNYQPFNYIFYENDIGSDIYFIISGQVEVIKYNNTDKMDKILARLNNGNYFGEMSFLSYLFNKPNFKRSATCRSITNLELIVIRSEFLRNLCNEYPFIIDHMKQTSELRHQSNKSIHPGRSDANNAVDFKNFKLDFRPLHSRSVSPINKTPQGTNLASTEPIHPKSRSQNQSPIGFAHPSNNINILSPSLGGPSSIGANQGILTPRPKTLKRSISLNLTPQYPTSSPNSFNPPVSEFDYIPHSKRLRLNSVGRRRSSVLAINSNLSDKLLIKIFEYLDLPTLMKLRIICKRWRQLLLLTPSLFNSLDLTPWNTSIDDKALIDIVKFVGARPSHIDISNCFHITDEGFSYMVNEIGISGKIKSLRMRSNWEISAMAIMDLTSPSVGKFLEEIDLSNCRKVRDNVLERLIGWNNSYNGGNEGEEKDVNEKEHDYDYDFDEDIGCKRLTKIKVGYCKHLTDKVMHHIGENCNDRLTELDLTRCTTITDKGFEYWTYKFFPSLSHLSLKDCTFLTDKSIISIANSVPNLKVLNLNFCCSLTDISVEVLSIGCQQLEELDLSFCGSAVSDSSLLAISLNLNLIKKLILKGCIRVTRAGIDSLLSSNSNLRYLDVGQCKNADFYPGAIPAQKLNINPETRSAFVTAGASNKIIEILI